LRDDFPARGRGRAPPIMKRFRSRLYSTAGFFSSRLSNRSDYIISIRRVEVVDGF